MTRFLAPALMLAAALAAAPALAATPLLPEKSDLSFTFKQMGVPVDGKFKAFSAQLDFDPKKPETGKIAFTVDLGSVSLGDASFDQEVAKADWFDTKRNGKATFASTSIKAVAPGRFDVAGKLTIKGATHDVVVPITLAQAGGVGTAAGAVSIKRLDFKIGAGDWADTSIVANDVVVKFKLAFGGL